MFPKCKTKNISDVTDRKAISNTILRLKVKMFSKHSKDFKQQTVRVASSDAPNDFKEITVRNPFLFDNIKH